MESKKKLYKPVTKVCSKCSTTRTGHYSGICSKCRSADISTYVRISKPCLTCRDRHTSHESGKCHRCRVVLCKCGEPSKVGNTMCAKCARKYMARWRRVVAKRGVI